MKRKWTNSPAALAVLAIAFVWLAVLVAWIALPAVATAGAYRAAVCQPRLGAGRADARFVRTSDHYAGSASCGRQATGDGLSVSHTAMRTRRGRWGGWMLKAPVGADLVGVRARLSGVAASGHVPELVAKGPSKHAARVGSARPDFRTVRWSGSGYRSLSGRLRCARRSRCGAGAEARMRIKSIVMSLRDQIAPTLDLAGPLVAPGARRGTLGLGVVANDTGSGVRSLGVTVNGTPLATRQEPCRLAGAIAVRLQPCPGQSGLLSSVNTASPPFHQGPNHVQACVSDYASKAAPNRRCQARTVRVDNLCPISDVGGGASLEARIEGAGRHGTVPSDRGAAIVGRLVGVNGAGIAGARVCVAGRTRLPGTVERVLATPVTGADGRFRAQLDPGPSQALRVAYWRDGQFELERRLDLDVRVHPELRLRPRGTLENGRRMRMVARLPGPRADHRTVKIRVRTHRHWQVLRSGRTDADGVFRSRYRFHATSGRRTYRFRAVVPPQGGYPYLGGRSKVRRKTVVG
jgi:hypothetical protein